MLTILGRRLSLCLGLAAFAAGALALVLLGNGGTSHGSPAPSGEARSAQPPDDPGNRDTYQTLAQDVEEARGVEEARDPRQSQPARTFPGPPVFLEEGSPPLLEGIESRVEDQEARSQERTSELQAQALPRDGPDPPP